MEQDAVTRSPIANSSETNNEKWWRIVTVITFVVAICGIGLGIYSIIKNYRQNERIIELEKRVFNDDALISEGNNFELIQYSSGGGFGTQAMCATITVSIDGDGKVILTNNYDSNVEKSFQISSDEYAALVHYISDHMSVFSVKERDHDDVLDGNSYYLLVKKKADNNEYKTGGYSAILDDDFQQISSRIISTIGEERYNSYAETVHSLD